MNQFAKNMSLLMDFPAAQIVKNLPTTQEIPGLGPLEKGMANHSSILSWRIPWTEEPRGPQSVGSQRGGHE